LEQSLQCSRKGSLACSCRVGEGRWWHWQWTRRAGFHGCNHLISDSFASHKVCQCQESMELQSEHRRKSTAGQLRKGEQANSIIFCCLYIIEDTPSLVKQVVWP
jgi:hypothetical protein